MYRNAKSASLIGAVALMGATVALAAGLNSGVPKGGMLSPFNPTHVSGPDKNTNTCPVCKYPTNPAVQVWMNDDNPKNVETIVDTLEATARANADKKLKAFVVFINPRQEPSPVITQRLEKLASAKHLQDVSLVYLPGPQAEAVSEYQINTAPEVRNTVFVYKNRKVVQKFVNFVADARGIAALNGAIQSVLRLS